MSSNSEDTILICQICKRYMIDPVVTKKCFHSFCRLCISLHIYSIQPNCPTCGKDLELQNAEPLIRDSIINGKLQRSAPSNYFEDLNRNRDLRWRRVPSEEECIFLCENNLSCLLHSLCCPVERIALCLEYIANNDPTDFGPEDEYLEAGCSQSLRGRSVVKMEPVEEEEERAVFKRFYILPANVSLKNLRHFLSSKLGIEPDELLVYFPDQDGITEMHEEWTLQEVGYMFGWGRKQALKIKFTFRAAEVIVKTETIYEESEMVDGSYAASVGDSCAASVEDSYPTSVAESYTASIADSCTASIADSCTVSTGDSCATSIGDSCTISMEDTYAVSAEGSECGSADDVLRKRRNSGTAKAKEADASAPKKPRLDSCKKSATTTEEQFSPQKFNDIGADVLPPENGTKGSMVAYMLRYGRVPTDTSPQSSSQSSASSETSEVSVQKDRQHVGSTRGSVNSQKKKRDIALEKMLKLIASKRPLLPAPPGYQRNARKHVH